MSLLRAQRVMFSTRILDGFRVNRKQLEKVRAW